MLTEREKDTLMAIEEYIKVKHFPPAIRDISKMLGVVSPSTTYKHVLGLKKKGYIESVPGERRTIRIIKNK